MVSHRRILLADDDDEVRLGLRDVLVAMGLEVVMAGTGEEAVEIGSSLDLHAALLDFHMPGYTGLECLPLLLEGRDTLPCIVMSGNLTRAIEREVLSAGAFSVLRKPVQLRILRSEVQRALGPWDAA